MSDSSSSRDLALIVAHPDDVAYCMGGTMLLLAAAGWRLHVICGTRGERGRTAVKWTGPGLRPPSTELGRTREAEERAVCERLGATLTFLDQIDCEFYADRATCERVAAQLAQLRPRGVFTMGPNEKPDHCASFAVAHQALNLAGLFWETERYHTLFFGETYHGRPDLYVNISTVIGAKRELCQLHRSQCDDEVWELVRQRSELWGRLAFTEHAEAFACGFPPMTRRFDRPARPLLWDLAV